MKKFRIRFIKEGSLMQPAIVSGNTTQEEMNKDPETEQMEQDQENSVVANSAPTLTPQQVEDMSDGEVLSNFYLNPTSDLPEDAYQALQNRAGDFANKVRVGNVTPDEMKKTSNALAAQNTKIQKGIGLGEAYSSGRVDGGDEYDFSGAISGHYDDRKTFEEFCLDLAWELEADLENQFALSGKEVYQTIEKWIEQNKEWVRERFGLHDEVTESDVIRARKMMLPIL